MEQVHANIARQPVPPGDRFEASAPFKGDGEPRSEWEIIEVALAESRAESPAVRGGDQASNSTIHS